MKKILSTGIAVFLTATVVAQPGRRLDGPPQPPPLTDRWAHDSTRLQLYVVLNGDQIGRVKTAFVSFYNDVDALMQQNKTVPPPKQAVEKILTKRNAALKTIFTAQQFDRFQTFEKEFMPPPPRPHKPPKPDANEKV